MLTFGVGQGAGQAGHPARPVVDLGEDRFALDVDVAALVEDGLRRLVVGGRHDHVAAVADAPAADRAKVDAARRDRLGQRRHGPRFVLQLDDELLGHGAPSAVWRADPDAPGAHRTGTAGRRLRYRPDRDRRTHDRGPSDAACPRPSRPSWRCPIRVPASRRRPGRPGSRSSRSPGATRGLGPSCSSTASRHRPESGGASGRPWPPPGTG